MRIEHIEGLPPHVLIDVQVENISDFTAAIIEYLSVQALNEANYPDKVQPMNPIFTNWMLHLLSQLQLSEKQCQYLYKISKAHPLPEK